jgi:hypothetical protein
VRVATALVTLPAMLVAMHLNFAPLKPAGAFETVNVGVLVPL